MVSFEDNAAKADKNPNKSILFNSENMFIKWPKKSLDLFLVEVMGHVPTEEAFDKLSNPFLNGLKNFSSHYEVFCRKCLKMVRVTKNGKVKDTYQFQCSDGDSTHYISATQILETIPDEWFIDILEIFDSSYKNQILDWINKEHLNPEIWELKGLKNANKRFPIQLSPVKDNSSKMRAVNHGLEEENRKLKEENAEMSAELRDLKKSMKALLEEVSNLRKYLLEKHENASVEKPPTITENAELKQNTFATITSIHRPPIIKKPLNLTPIDIISKPSYKVDGSDRPPYSPLKIYFFEGCHRKSPGLYRKMLLELGFNTRHIRDITFLSEDLMQVTAYESAIEDLTKLLVGISDKVRRLDDFNPIKGESYAKYGCFSDEEVEDCYFSIMKKSAERLSKAAESVKALKRSANFLSKVIENKTVNYQSVPRKEKVFFLGNLIDYVKPARTESEMVVDTDIDSSIKPENNITNSQ